MLYIVPTVEFGAGMGAAHEQHTEVFGRKSLQGA
jgi:hypothetical protein